MLRYEREIRGIPLWLIRDYLHELGGQEGGGGQIEGIGWSVSLYPMDDFQIGSVRVGQVRLVLEAIPNTYESIRQALEKKLLRAGG